MTGSGRRDDEGFQDPFPDGIVAGPEVDEDKHPLARTIWTAVLSILVLVVLIGVFVLVSYLTRETRTVTDQVAVTGGQVTIGAGSADVQVVEGSGEQVVATARVEHGLVPASYELRRTDAGIVIDSGCRPVLSPGCSVAVTVQVPADLPVEVRSTSGDVDVRGLADRVVTVRTGSGDVEGSGLAVTELSVLTRSGDIEADFSQQPFAFKAQTESGDVDAEIPAGTIRYQAKIESRSGEVESDVTDDPQGDGFMVVESDSGDIEVQQS